MSDELNRCRLVLVVDAGIVVPAQLLDAIDGGDVASVILHAGSMADHDFSNFCDNLISPLQTREIAVLVADNTQVFGRSTADGFFASKPSSDLADYIDRFSPQNIVGCGGIKDRHQALQIGELKPDFLLFGKLGGDIKPEPHRKNLALAEWWSEFVEIPALLMGGRDLAFAKECAQTGADFVGFASAVFENDEFSAKAAVGQINAIFDEYAPRFDEGN